MINEELHEKNLLGQGETDPVVGWTEAPEVCHSIESGALSYFGSEIPTKAINGGRKVRKGDVSESIGDVVRPGDRCVYSVRSFASDLIDEHRQEPASLWRHVGTKR